jgi:4'-phosphopantetheinyl transferase
MDVLVESHRSAWSRPRQHPELVPGTVHIWRAALDVTGSPTQPLLEVLTADEVRRAERYRFARDRALFVATRGRLRILLGGYLDLAPSAVALTYGPSGKPEVATTWTRGRLHFNVSRSDDIALFAFALDRRVGVDVERVRPAIAAETVVEHFFSPAEVAALRGLPAASQAQAFFNGWTRKEAYVKATGRGIGDGFGDFTVSLRPDEPAAFCTAVPASEDVARWSLCALDPAPGYAAALVVEGHGWRLERYDAEAAAA